MSKIIFSILCALFIIRIINLLIIRHKVRKLLIKTIEIFEIEKVDYWVDFGSLLGSVREQDVIFGDNDADVCITDELTNLNKVREIVRARGGKELDWGAFRIYDGLIFIDIFIAKTEGNKYIIPDTTEPTPINLIQPVVKREITINKKSFIASLPSNIDDLLKFRYGNDYMKPDRKWWRLWL